MERNELTHYGILGMKWGVRRSKSQLARAKGSSKKSSSDENTSEDYKKAHSSKSVKTMSDRELRDRINRIQMEKQYKQLTSSETSAGRKFVQDVVLNAAKQTATSYVSKYMTKGVDTLLKAAIKKK